MKRIVICCDGTWNSEGDKTSSNVWKLHQLLLNRDSKDIEQRAFYLPGVGTDPSRSWVRRTVNRIGGGSFGWTLDAHIIEAYRWLIREYEPGDELWLFGFSRGAYTARSMVGLLRNCGLLKRHHESMTNRALRLYRARDPNSAPDAPQSRSFRDNYSHTLESIMFVGVWDTVGALGIPGILGTLTKFWNRRYRFHDVQLSRRVKNAYHALAVDERRPAFRPTLWEGGNLDEQQTMEQVWFAGVHSDVGGGYEEAGLSDIPLLWMIDKATARGLGVDERRIPAMTEPDVKGEMHDSRWSLHKLLHIQQLRNITSADKQSIDKSVFDRMDQISTYRPKNV